MEARRPRVTWAMFGVIAIGLALGAVGGMAAILSHNAPIESQKRRPIGSGRSMDFLRMIQGREAGLWCFSYLV